MVENFIKKGQQRACMLILMFCIASKILHAQDILLPRSQDGLLTFENLGESVNSKDVLYKNLQAWIAQSFGDYKSVVQFEDKAAGRIILKGVSVVAIQDIKRLRYVMTIDVRDQKYRCISSNIEVGFNYLSQEVIYRPYESSNWGFDVNGDVAKRIGEIQEKQKNAGKSQYKYLQRKIENYNILRDRWIKRGEDLDRKIYQVFSNHDQSLKIALNKNDDF